MVTDHKVTGTAASWPAGLGTALAVSMGITVLGAVIGAKLILSGLVPEEGSGYCSMVILLLASVLGAVTATRRIKHRRALCCLLAGVCYYIALLAVTALLFGGNYTGMGVTALVILGGVGAVMLLGNRRGRHSFIKPQQSVRSSLYKTHKR